jgi:hypothetical protein
MERDFAVVESKSNCLSVEKLRDSMKGFDAARWIVFVYGPKRVERIVARSSITMPDMSNIVTIDRLPEDSRTFFLCPKAPVDFANAEVWWNEPPQTTETMDAYVKAATDFLRDLRSDTPLGSVNRLGLWITLRAIASIGYVPLPNSILTCVCVCVIATTVSSVMYFVDFMRLCYTTYAKARTVSARI